MEIVEPGECLRQVGLDELQRPAPGFQPDFDENSRRVSDVVTRRFHEPRHLMQLRDDAPSPFGLRSVAEQRLSGQAGADDIRIDLGIALPGPNGFQFVDPPLNIGGDHGVFHLLVDGKPSEVDLLKSAA